MKLSEGKYGVSGGMPLHSRLVFALVVYCLGAGGARADEFASRLADRTAVERVYHQHRTGTKPVFEEAMPAALLSTLTQLDEQKEATLARVYGVVITPVMLQAEVSRIDATTRAADVLAEIKHALGDDTARFARAVARPIVVERTLRAHFENDDVLHAPQRALAEQIRDRLLAAPDAAAAAAVLKEARAGMVAENTWQLTPRPAVDAPVVPVSLPTSTAVSAQSITYAFAATAQIAEVIEPPTAEADRTFYFEDLDPELQGVLRAQLQGSGDVSAVIETPDGFLLFLATQRGPESLSVASLTIAKRSYEEWLAQQAKDNP